MEMQPVSLSPVSTTESPVSQAEIVDTVGAEYKAYTPLYDRFGISETKDERVNRNLDVIWKWAEANSDVKDKDSVLWQVTKLSQKLGHVPHGSAPYVKILNYISEFNRMTEAENRLKEMIHV